MEQSLKTVENCRKTAKEAQGIDMNHIADVCAEITDLIHAANNKFDAELKPLCDDVVLIENWYKLYAGLTHALNDACSQIFDRAVSERAKVEWFE